jgi:signal transduction histidine kinase
MLNEDSSAWVLQAASPQTKNLAVQNEPGLIKKLSKPRYINGSGRGTLLDQAWQKRYQSCWSIPLATGGRTAGVMQFGFSKDYEWLPREQELLAAAAERCLMAAEKARLMEDLAQREEQVRRLAEHMLHVEEIERRRISRELHDEAGQSLLCIRLQMELLEQELPEKEGAWKAKLREARDLTERTILEMRRLIAALSPAVLEQLGLGAALRQLINRFQRLHPCRVKLQLSKMGVLPQQIEVIAYRLVQECFNNIGKHAGASIVNISLATADGLLKLVVEDNGIGFNVTEALAKRESFGLSGMRERVALLGGAFQVDSRTEGTKTGTKISIELPIAK